MRVWEGEGRGGGGGVTHEHVQVEPSVESVCGWGVLMLVLVGGECECWCGCTHALWACHDSGVTGPCHELQLQQIVWWCGGVGGVAVQVQDQVQAT